MEISKGVILVSGGMDSTTLMYQFVDKGVEFVPLFINYGQHCATHELDTLRQVIPAQYANKLETLDVSGIYRYSNSRFIKVANLWEENIKADDLYIPYRNVLLLTIAASFAQTLGLNKVYSAFINSNHAKEIDCSSEFFDKLEGLLSEYGSVKIEMPFRNMTKYDVAKLGIKLKAPIGLTFSCQASPEIPCGACPNCVDRLNALKQIEKEAGHYV
jgi:7-cyano-7-deazaguanine synthase